MTRALMLGDSHGNFPFIRNGFDLADREGIRLVIQLGDFGFWPAPPRTPLFSDRVHSLAEEYGLTVLVIDGNHDDPNDYDRWSNAVPDLSVPGLVHVPRGTVLDIDGHSVGCLGGAVSIDMERRVPGRSWWSEESLTNADVGNAVLNGSVIDVMLSHDAPIPPDVRPWTFSDTVTEALWEQQRRFTAVLNHWQPTVHLHGHWHHRYSCDTPWGVRYGLGAENLQLGSLVYDFENLRVVP